MFPPSHTGRSAMVFPGQGSQTAGLAHSLIAAWPDAAERVAAFSDIADYDITELLCGDTITSDPVNVHLAMVSYGILAWEFCNNAFGYTPSMFAGHSLGEITALCCAGVISPADALLLARKRGELLAKACTENEGGMLAVVGAPVATIKQLYAEWAASQHSPKVWLANINSPTQLVVSGAKPSSPASSGNAPDETSGSLQHFSEHMEALGMTCIPLATAGAFHTPHMKEAAAEMYSFCQSCTFNAPAVPVISSMTGRLYEPATDASTHLALQIVSPVVWLDVMGCMQRAHITTIVEGGPEKGILGRLASKMPAWNPEHYVLETILQTTHTTSQ